MKSKKATSKILQSLGERVKELTALHRTARILQNNSLPSSEVIQEVVAVLPDAWQFSDVTAARISFADMSFATDNFAETAWMQRADFTTLSGQRGKIEVCYLVPKPPADEGPFLAEERALIDSLAEMLRSYFQHKTAEEALRATQEGLEQQVRQRTAELSAMNRALQEQIAEHKKAQEKIDGYQEQLRKLASQLSITEARERRAIASDLHDHIGQALAFIKMKISRFRGDTIFCGFEQSLEEILTLLDQTVQYTRSLTFEISPPVLYELGLEAALEWLAEQFQKKHNFRVKVVMTGNNGFGRPSDEVQVVLFKAVQELLTNAVKYANTHEAIVTLGSENRHLIIKVEDRGTGFCVSQLEPGASSIAGFGLFSIRERLQYLGGQVAITSAPGQGTVITLTAPLSAGGKS